MAHGFAMRRFCFEHDGLIFSYLDSGGPLPIMVALHAHWMEGSTFIPLAEALGSEWRVIALDQRGHGYSDHAESYGPEGTRRVILSGFKLSSSRTAGRKSRATCRGCGLGRNLSHA